jgi:hypothetical protein
MRTLILAAWLGLAGTAVSAAPAAAAAGPASPESRLAAQREAMKALVFMDGAWRGTVETGTAAGRLVQTERVGPLLDGTVKLVEGRGHDASGKAVFNAFAVISYEPEKRVYVMRSYAMGRSGDFPLNVRPDGFDWSHPAGPGATMRYTATIRNGEWVETARGSPAARRRSRCWRCA